MDATSDTVSFQSSAPSRVSGRRRWSNALARAVMLCGVGVTAVTAAQLVATRWWFADLLTQFTVQYVILLTPAVLVMLWYRRWRSALLFVLALICNAWLVTAYYGPVPLAARSGKLDWNLRIMTQNVLRPNTDYQKVRELIEQLDPDIVALQEVDPAWMNALAGLRNVYPHVHFAEYPGNFGISLFCKFPWDSIDVQLNGPLELPSIHARFSRQGRAAFELVNTHPPPPEGRQHSEYRNEQLLVAAHEMDPGRSRIMVGDFNLTPWSPWFREILRRGNLVDSARGWGVAPTWHLFPSWLGGVKIDHVLISPDIVVEHHQTGPYVGSDHRAVVVDIRIPGDLTDNPSER